MMENSQIKLSIVVPVYQAEKYLRECLGSLVAQNLDKYEVICVDDGSTDGSSAIIHEFINENSNIEYIYQNNQGVSAARNRGLKAARGKYIMFVDADDCICKNSLRYLYDTSEKKKTDILVFGGKMDLNWQAPEWMRMAFYTRNRVYSSFSPNILFCEPGAQPFVLNKVFLRKCIQDIVFPDNIHIAEDQVFLFLVFPKCSKIAFTSKSIYRYRISNQKSAMHLFREKRMDYMSNHLSAADIIIASWGKYGYLDGNIKEFSEWLTAFLREPFNLLSDDEKNSFMKKIDDIYMTFHLSNLLLIPESFCNNGFTLKRILHILSRDLCKYGLKGGVENLIYKLLFRRKLNEKNKR